MVELTTLMPVESVMVLVFLKGTVVVLWRYMMSAESVEALALLKVLAIARVHYLIVLVFVEELMVLMSVEYVGAQVSKKDTVTVIKT